MVLSLSRNPYAIRRTAIGMFATLATLAVAAGAADEYQDFAELNLEALLDQTIVTAAKHEQKISETPVAATVISAEEIAASGARNIPELLDRVAGLSVIQSSSSSFEVSARGLNELASNAMLVLIDGRSVYEEFYGVTVWEALAVSLEDIKAIEVIKGPGSAMYGANAFAGVINILTFAPDEKPGTSARTFVSNLGESQGTLRAAGRQRALAWSASTTWDRSLDWEHDLPEAEAVRTRGRFTYDLGDRTTVSCEAGHFNGSLEMLPTNTTLLADGQTHFLRSDFTHGNLVARWYLNDWTLDIEPRDVALVGVTAAIESRLHDLEFQHSFAPSDDSFVLWGGSYRHKRFSYSLQDGKVTQDIYAAFALGEWTPRRAWLLSLGVRYEDHPLVGGHAAPRGGVVFKPHADHALRFSYSQAYRDPSYLETYWRTETELAPGMASVVRGDLDVASEEIRSCEIGYQGLVTSGALVNLAVFHNQLEDLIQAAPVAYFSSPPAPHPGIPSEIVFQNLNSWDATGGELACEVDVDGGLRLSGFYAYTWLEDAATGARIVQAPLHSAQARATLRLGRQHELRLAGRYRSVAEWNLDLYGGTGTVAGDERLVVDTAWQVHLAPAGHRFTLAIENILDRRYRDHPLAIEQGRRLYASLMVGF
ncbi:MAG TPA: TonB-dependent receptor [Candidatus Krumholzibacteria bacterium]|nr:TonB-dependent receptor [Candidatus Krumholzibacteria bacterium]HPD73202.1 TonB-dependent receptor [Candidatus Krumholzibacteria bacterium]HRY40164.1 TonB-dependent receptor [Candidatus Krumholzibacteria bacterium]